MGKNRTHYPPTYEYQPEGIGGLNAPPVILETDGHSTEWMETLIGRIHTWLASGLNDINDLFDKDQLDYLKKHMKYYDGKLMRVEHPHHFDELNLKEGDSLNLDEIRSFTRDSAIDFLTGELIGNYDEGAVVYMINGSPQFNFDAIDNFFGERESVVKMSELKVKSITDINDDNLDDRYEKYFDATGDSSYGDVNKLPKQIKVVELEYTGNNKTPDDSLKPSPLPDDIFQI